MKILCQCVMCGWRQRVEHWHLTDCERCGCYIDPREDAVDDHQDLGADIEVENDKHDKN